MNRPQELFVFVTLCFWCLTYWEKDSWNQKSCSEDYEQGWLWGSSSSLFWAQTHNDYLFRPCLWGRVVLLQGVVIVVQQVNLLLRTGAQVQAPLLPIQLPSPNACSGRQLVVALGSYHLCGRPGPSLRPGPVPAVVSNWGLN